MLSNLETNFDREYSDTYLMSRFSKYFGTHKKDLLITTIAILISTSLQIIIPFTLEKGTDFLINGNVESAIQIGYLFFGLYITTWVADYFRTLYTTKFTAKTTRDIRDDLFEKIQNHDLQFFDSNSTGKLISRVQDDTQLLGGFTAQTSVMLVNILVATGSIIVMFIYNIQLTLIALSVIPFLAILIFFFRFFARKLTRKWRVAISKLNDTFQENISGISVAKSFGRITKSRNEFEDLNKENYTINTIRAMYFSSIFPLIFAISNIGLYLVLRYGSIWTIETGEPGVNVLVFYIALLQRFYFPIVWIFSFYNQVQAGFAATERVFSLMDVQSKVKDTGVGELQDIKGKIEFHNMSFSYEKGIDVYENFNLTISAGETVAIVGHTGSGKSTLISLLLRFYEIDGGDILIDNISIRELKIKSYRSNIGMVLQNPLLFSGTIRDNICYGLEEIPNDEEIIKYAKYANAWEFISQQPSGLDTVLHERGKGLSQGQRQLISIARAFIVDPQILLLDEATASIDAYSEALIQEAIDRLLSDRTSIIIAHRLTTIKRVDRIIVLEKGKVIETGDHKSLISKKGKYSDLYNTYFAFQEFS